MPTTRDEAWRFTNLAPLTRVSFEPSKRPVGGESLAFSAELSAMALPTRLLFLNGHLVPGLASLGDGAAPAAAGSLAAALLTGITHEVAAQPSRLRFRASATVSPPASGTFARPAWDGAGEEARLAAYDALAAELGRQARGSVFDALNTALFRDGAFVYVRADSAIDTPIHILHLSTPNGGPVAVHPRNLILLAPNSRASIVETYWGPEGRCYLCNPVTEIVVGEGAKLAHCRVQLEGGEAFHIGSLGVSAGARSEVSLHSVDLGGALVRSELTANLMGEECELALNGLYLAAGRQHIDNHTRIEHLTARCNSRELYKGVLQGQSRAVFQGRIVVHPGAQKTDSKQTNNNLLLSDDALIHSQPQLEIYADDVKCTHGATVGRLEEEALFYLCSRGIDREAARNLLIHAFAGDMVSRLPVQAVRDLVANRMGEWLKTGTAVKEAR
jgi:Fe-S cluster assembly protein SufD